MWVDNPKIQLIIEDVLNKFEAQIVKSIFIDLEEKLFEIRDHRFHERKDDVVRVKNVYVGSGLAQLDTSDGCGLCHGF